MRAAEKKFSINFSKSKTKFCLSLHYYHDNNHLFVNGKQIYKFKINNKNVNFQTQFCLPSISNQFAAAESRQESFKGNMYDFSVDYNSMYKSDILNMHRYFIVKYNIK